MPLLRFTKLLDKVRNHEKKQTIRKPRKNPLKENDTLHVYVLEKLGTARIIDIKQKKLKDITEEEAKNDGFNTKEECIKCICDMHKCTSEEIFEVINYEPEWPKMFWKEPIPPVNNRKIEKNTKNISEYFVKTN